MVKIIGLPDNGLKTNEALLSSKILRYIAFAHHFGYIFAGHPYRWNTTERRIEFVGWGRRMIWRINMVMGFSYVFFVYFRCIQINLDDTRSNSDQIYMRVMAAYHSISVVCYLGVIMNVDVLPGYTNQLLEFSASLMGKSKLTIFKGIKIK
ncbi:unnamed protein product [Allacma fusca]|uniref:Uncharacterized protein n=1 Tax=Allacma fusca TaxID=39272 RepID=A0A8J2LPU2_9HEXA|nr:unnamed protein product [Allacma fusca]